MDTTRLYEILDATTAGFRKGAEVERERVGDVEVVNIYGFPHVDEAAAGIEQVDLHFISVGVKTDAARECADEVKQILADYPQPERLEGGPSYIEMGATIGSQDAALRLFALGKVIGLWDIITPERLGMSGESAKRAAGAGYVMCTGWKP